MNLYSHQLDALKKIKNGCILNGGVGSGKSLTSIAYYYMVNGGSIDFFSGATKGLMTNPQDLYIITTAQKRENLEWEKELLCFHLSTKKEDNLYSNKVVVDSWNNIKKYKGVYGAFFIFDEQRVTGSGVWVKSFLEISKKNKWILLSATPGDTWSDYIPVFVANGFYKNKTDFCNKHAIWSRYSNYPKIERYFDTGHLLMLRNSILVDMSFERDTVQHHNDILVSYDKTAYKDLLKTRWNYEKQAPIKNASELCYQLRKIVNSDSSRQSALLDILEDHERVIVFYNYDYELDILESVLELADIPYFEYNGHRHDSLPDMTSWVYLVNYSAGNAGWNCITTDTMVFYSQNYSYKVMVQSAGRIDRINTPYKDLYYYHFKSTSNIDLAIAKALRNKQAFNESAFANLN